MTSLQLCNNSSVLLTNNHRRFRDSAGEHDKLINSINQSFWSNDFVDSFYKQATNLLPPDRGVSIVSDASSTPCLGQEGGSQDEESEEVLNNGKTNESFPGDGNVPDIICDVKKKKFNKRRKTSTTSNSYYRIRHVLRNAVSTISVLFQCLRKSKKRPKASRAQKKRLPNWSHSRWKRFKSDDIPMEDQLSESTDFKCNVQHEHSEDKEQVNDINLRTLELEQSNHYQSNDLINLSEHAPHATDEDHFSIPTCSVINNKTNDDCNGIKYSTLMESYSDSDIHSNFMSEDNVNSCNYEPTQTDKALTIAPIEESEVLDAPAECEVDVNSFTLENDTDDVFIENITVLDKAHIFESKCELKNIDQLQNSISNNLKLISNLENNEDDAKKEIYSQEINTPNLQEDIISEEQKEVLHETELAQNSVDSEDGGSTVCASSTRNSSLVSGSVTGLISQSWRSMEDVLEDSQDNIVTLRRSRTSKTLMKRQSMYRYSVTRPSTVIFGLGVHTETEFFSHTYGDGVSESESENDEDEEEDDSPAITPSARNPSLMHINNNNSNSNHSTSNSRGYQKLLDNNHALGNNSSIANRGTSPNPPTTSRSHSPLSDMDVSSKRNSQITSTEPSEGDEGSMTSDLESCPDPSSPRSSLLYGPAHSHDPPGPVVPDLLPTFVPGHDSGKRDKAYRIALELLHTERTYVHILNLIDQKFQFQVDHENRAHHMFPQDQVPLMFSNIKSIYKLHHDFLLPQLEDRMSKWDDNPRIGDIMKNFAPFLKMYTEYVRNFDNAMTIINHWQVKCVRFAAIMDNIHQMEACGNLTLQHHMLSPVQRIPRYEMLIRDYLKKLHDDSLDRHDTQKALELVSMAANHANDAMKKIDKFEKLLEIQESIGGAVDLVSPTRELLKEGKIIKISARSGDHQERYIFLLTDLLLLCSPRLIGGRVMSGPQYRLRAKYHVENLQVLEGDNLETANTFYIRDSSKTVELYTHTIEEKQQWLEALFQAIQETFQRKSSLKLHLSADQRIVDADLGHKQPTFIRTDSVTKCMLCSIQFTMVRRKHHCRACGMVVCNKCSSYKAHLACESGKSVRVCSKCHVTLQELSSGTTSPSPDHDICDTDNVRNSKDLSDFAFRTRGILEVSAKASGAVMQGSLQLKTHRKAWLRRWFALHTDFVLYSFKSEDDSHALTATPVPGYTVTHLQGTRSESGLCDKDKEKAFKLHHSKKHYIFLASSKEDCIKWVTMLQKASQAEPPSPVQ